jgi:hypothetical protein
MTLSITQLAQLRAKGIHPHPEFRNVWTQGASALQREAARQNAMHIHQRRASA